MQPPPAPAPTVPAPRPERGQVWSAPSPSNGRLYIRIAAVRLPKSDAPYATSVRITPDGTRLLDTILKREYLRTMLDPGTRAMPINYTFEPTLTAETETLDMSTNSPEEGQENPMSTNPTETVPTAATVPAPKTTKKVPGIPSPKATRIATMKANPTPENITNVLLGGPVTPKAATKKAAKSNGILRDPGPTAADLVPPVAKKPAVKKAKPAPKATKKAEGATHFTDEKIASFMTRMLAKDPETNRSAAIKAYREAGNPGGEIRLRVLFDAALRAAKKNAKK
jgi:hypothetical protein